MIEFKPVSIKDRDLYEKYHMAETEHGCDHTFTNLVMWGQQNISLLSEGIALFSHYMGQTFYPFPLGENKGEIIREIILDAKERNIPCVFTDVAEADKKLLNELFPQRFRFTTNADTYDYVYDINDLADLGGRKYHAKRNHLNRFAEEYPAHRFEMISENNIEDVRKMLQRWYEEKLSDSPDSDFAEEQKAINTALDHFEELGLEGIMLLNNNDILAFSMGSRMSPDTFDIHFEKALADVNGGYAAINRGLALHIRDKYPDVKFLNREDDMGIEGLRKAKQSYRPHHMVKKYRAYLCDDTEIIQNPEDESLYGLRALWKEAFGDSDEFLDTFFSTAYSKKRSRCITIDGDVAAALYFFDCEYREKRFAYIYAVATSKIHRGKGLCHKLMEDTHTYLAEKGYDGALLVPAEKELFDLYKNMGYEICSYVDEFTCDKADDAIEVKEISKEEYSKLRKCFLPENGVIQEKESMDFLAEQGRFYTGEGFLLCASNDEESFRGIELLGNKDTASGILHTLGADKGVFRTVGSEKAFAMYKPLTEDVSIPSVYFGLAFD